VTGRNVTAGGLAVGLLAALRRRGGVWFGWDGELTEGEPSEPDVHMRDGVTYVSSEFRREEFELYYNGFANGALWPIHTTSYCCMSTAASARLAYSWRSEFLTNNLDCDSLRLPVCTCDSE
jgi:trehalose-6-phosphate synthase